MRFPTLSLILLGMLATSLPLLASAVQDGSPLKGTVVAAKALDAKKGNWELMVTLLEDPKAPVVQGQKVKKGDTVRVEVEGEQRNFKKGDPIEIHWRYYSGMTPKGAITTLSWQLVPANAPPKKITR